MTQNSPIESFIKKYRSATSAKSKELRLSIEEATDLICAFATMNTSNDDIVKVLNSISKDIQELKNGTNQSSGLDGGRF